MWGSPVILIIGKTSVRDMIEQLIIKNYESYKRAILKFSPGLNIFVGETNAGKSGIFRAMRFLLFNKPLGQSMIPIFWDGITKVSAKFSDCTITKIKDNNKTYYKLNKDKQILAGKGLPPDCILDAINMNSINFQTQINNPFLMFESGGERGKVLNKIAGLEDIDRALINSKRDELRLKNEIKYIGNTLENSMKDLLEFDYIESLDSKLTDCEYLESKLIRINSKRVEVENILDKLQELTTDIQELDIILQIETKLKAVESLISKIQSITSSINSVEYTLNKILTIDTKILKIPDLHKILQIKPNIKRFVDLGNKTKVINKILQEIKSRTSDIDNITNKMSTIQKKLPPRCPSCLQLVKK